MNKNVSGISPAALKIIRQYDWPGNVRQLENAIERAVLMAKTSRIESVDLNFISKTISENITDPRNPDEGLLTVAAKAAAEAESAMIKRVLVETKGNKSQAARKLKISYRVMLKKIKDYQIAT